MISSLIIVTYNQCPTVRKKSTCPAGQANLKSTCPQSAPTCPSNKPIFLSQNLYNKVRKVSIAYQNQCNRLCMG